MNVLFFLFSIYRQLSEKKFNEYLAKTQTHDREELSNWLLNVRIIQFYEWFLEFFKLEDYQFLFT